MAFDRLQQPFIKLEELIRAGERTVVPFIGAGLSAHGSIETRLPLWNQLLNRMKKRAEEYGLLSPKDSENIDELIGDWKLIQATDLLIASMGEKQFRLFIEEILDVSEKPIPPAITELVAVSWSLLVTTNLDRFIERAWLAKYGQNLEIATSMDVVALAQSISGNRDQPTLAKIHGTIERYETWILSSRHYDLLLQNNSAYVNSLKNLFLRTVFFIGYGLTDADFQLFLDQVALIYPAGVGTFFALLDSRLKGTPALNKLIREHGVQPIWYTYDPACAMESDGGYEEVLECLQLLTRAWARAKKAVPVKLKYFPELEPDFVGRLTELETLATYIFSDPPRHAQIIGFGGEGKTSLVQQFIHVYREELLVSSYKAVFGCSFYRADVGRFINDAYYALHPAPRSIDIASKVEELSKIFIHSPILLILDGMEAIQSDNGDLANPYINDLVTAATTGRTTLLITTRIPLPAQMDRLYLNPLSEEESSELLDNWGVLPIHLRQLIRDKVGRHALSVRILAGLIRGGDGGKSNLREFHLIDTPDEANRLKANKATQVLDYYQRHLTEMDRLFMQCFSVFRRPIAISTVLSCLDSDVFLGKFKVIDLRYVINDLLEKRLLIPETGSLLTIHPLVREYFARHTPHELALALHRKVANYHLASVGDKAPASFEEHLTLFDACYHAACAEEWSLFHDIFFRRLNREHENYVGNTLGAWEEFLDLVLMTFPKRDSSQEPVIYPTYYRAAAARALKHLGRSIEARSQYIECIKLCAGERDTEVARYLNNFLSLSLCMGRLDTACKLAPLNAATLKWINTDWRRRWQTEFALFSIGYLCALTGNLVIGEELCRHADHVWDDQGEARKWFFDYYRSYYADVVLASGPDREEEAIEIAHKSLKIGERYGWKETTAVALRSLSSAFRSLYIYRTRHAEDLKAAIQYLSRAKTISSELRVPRLEVDILLEETRLAVAPVLAGEAKGLNFASISYTRDRINFLVDQCSLSLYKPELYALNAWLCLLRGPTENAHAYHLQALKSAAGIGNAMIIHNRCGLLEPLSQRIVTITETSKFSRLPVFLNLEDFFSQEIDQVSLLSKIAEIGTAES